MGATSAVGLSADGIHSSGETGENRVAGDVSKADGEGTSRKREGTEAAEEEHGDHGSGVEEKGSEDKGKGERKEGLCFSEKGRGEGSWELGVKGGGFMAARRRGVEEEIGEGEE